MALMAPAFVGVVGLSVETGYWYFLQDKAQIAVDMSAYSAAVSLRNGDTADVARSKAAEEAAHYGYNGGNAEVQVTIPPRGGAGIGAKGAEVSISYNAPRFFSSLFSKEPIRHTVHARSQTKTGSPACILALNPDAGRAIELSGNASITLTGCEMMSNSLSDSAFYISGSADVDVDCVSVSGDVAQSGRAHSLHLDCAALKTRQPPAPDPYSTVPAPDLPSRCESIRDVSRSSANGGRGAYQVSAGDDGKVRFCRGLQLKSSYHFDPGIYIIDGGKFSLNASADISGDGVTFYLTGGAELKWNGRASINVTAPTTGPYAGIAVMGDRGDFNARHKINGSASSNLTGAIYTAASPLQILGNFSGEEGCMQIIASTIKLSGATNINHDCRKTGIRWAEVGGEVILVE